jgi:hypothetical protein
MMWVLLNSHMTFDDLGFIPTFLDEDDPRPAKEQIDARYISGWQSFKGFTLDPKTGIMTYPEDPPLKPLAMTQLRDEQILFYECVWLAIVQPDGSFEVARLD